MRQDTVVRFRKKDDVVDPLTEVLRRVARGLIERAVSEEFEVFLQQHPEQRDAQGRATVVRNGYLPEREVLSGIGPVPVCAPRSLITRMNPGGR
jgi:hypothetical protein